MWSIACSVDWPWFRSPWNAEWQTSWGFPTLLMFVLSRFRPSNNLIIFADWMPNHFYLLLKPSNILQENQDIYSIIIYNQLPIQKPKSIPIKSQLFTVKPNPNHPLHPLEIIKTPRHLHEISAFSSVVHPHHPLLRWVMGLAKHSNWLTTGYMTS